jgi:hypothetical protein
MAIYIDSAVFWAQFRVRGGWKNLFIVTLTYALVVVFCISLFHGIADTPRNKAYMLETASIMVMGVQILLLALLGSSMVASAIRKDVTNKQIESNRLMPLPPVQAVTGYIAGSMVHVLALAAVNLLIGAVLALLRGLPVVDWIIVNAELFFFSVSLWATMAMAAFVSRAMFGVLFGLCAGILFSGGFIFVLVPGLLTLCSPMQNATVFQVSGITRLSTGTVVAVAAQMLFTALFIRGAARKYVDPDAQSFTLAPALALLGIWSGLTFFGIVEFFVIRPVTLEYSRFDWHVMAVGSVASCLVVALLPLAAVAQSDVAREQLRLVGEKVPTSRWQFGLCLAACVLFAIAPLSANLDQGVLQTIYYSISATGVSAPILTFGKNPSLGMIAAACGIFFIEMYLLMRLLYSRVKRPNLLIFLVIVLTWFAPLLADMIYFGTKDLPGNPPMDQFALLSPIGVIMQAIDTPMKATWTGLAIQAMLPALLAILVALSQMRGRSRLNQGEGFAVVPPSLPIPAPEPMAQSSS